MEQADATWELVDEFKACFPDFQLEDELFVEGGRDVMIGKVRGVARLVAEWWSSIARPPPLPAGYLLLLFVRFVKNIISLWIAEFVRIMVISWNIQILMD
jgi:hypothetical protein